MPGVNDSDPTKANVGTGPVLGPVERAIFEKYNKKVCNSIPLGNEATDPINECINAEDALLTGVIEEFPVVGLEETLEAVNPSEDVVVSESTGLQLLSYFDKVLPEENEVEVPVTSSFGDNMKQSVANSDDPIPFLCEKILQF